MLRRRHHKLIEVSVVNMVLLEAAVLNWSRERQEQLTISDDNLGAFKRCIELRGRRDLHGFGHPELRFLLDTNCL